MYTYENEKLIKKLMSSIDSNDEPVVYVAKILTLNLEETSANKILKEWYNKELFVKLEQHYDEYSELERIDEMLSDWRVAMIRRWRSEGKLRGDLEDGLILAIFKAISYIDIHKTDIGIKYFPKALEYITEFIMRGLTGSQNNS